MTKNKIADFIKGIIEKCSGERYIFRGENMKYPRPVSSGLYRQFCLQGKGKDAPSPIKSKGFSVVSVEKKRLENARRHFSSGAKNIDVLTGLRHYGGDTALIDFSYNLHIALYFACEGNYQDDGCLYFYKESQFDSVDEDIKYRAEDKNKDRLVVPTDKNARVVFQNSVFVHSYRGFLDVEKDGVNTIPKNDKNDILDYLGNYFSINSETVYNDIHGFIENQSSYTMADIELYRGFTNHEQRDWSKAIYYYGKAIEIDPRYALAYGNRGLANFLREDYSKAIADFDKAIELGLQVNDIYYYRGIVKVMFEDMGGAKKDLDVAIEKFLQQLTVHKNNIFRYSFEKNEAARAVEVEEKNAVTEMLAKAYNKRSIVRRYMGDEQGAEEDFRKAKELREEKKKE